MKRLSIIGCKAFVSEWLEKDKVEGKPYCIYKEGYDKSKQPKGFPKHFETEEAAERYLAQMEMFKDITERKKKWGDYNG